MSVVRENLDVLNPAGSDTNLSRTTEINFFGFRDSDSDVNEVNTGIGDTIYTAASSSTFPNPLSQPDKHPTFGGTFTGVGTITYKVEISDHQSTPNKFVWYKNGALQASGAETDITSGTAQNLDNGVTITFNSSQGDTGYYKDMTQGVEQGDFWEMTTVLSTDSPHQLGRIHAKHEGAVDDTRGVISFKTNNGGAPGVVSNVGAVAISGDMVANGTFYSPYIIDKKDFFVKIDEATTPADKFTWSEVSDFATIQQQNVVIDSTANVSLPGLSSNVAGQLLSYSNGTSTNVVVAFSSNTGHTLNDEYKFTVFSTDSMEISSNGAVTFGAQVLNIEGANLNVRIFDVNNNLINTA